MPVLMKRKMVNVPVGIRCDVCGMTDENGCNDFAINHTFGYGSPHDMTSVTAALCDNCLMNILLKHIPGAVFQSEFQSLNRDEILAVHEKHHAAKTETEVAD